MAGADGDLERCWADAHGSEHHILRREWTRLEPLIVRAVGRGGLDAGAVVGAVVGALQRAFPGGAALVRFVDHPAPEVRSAALSAAVASGHPHALRRLATYGADPDPAVVAAQQALRRSPPPLTFRLLGGFEVRRANWELDHACWGRALVVRLVRYLVVHRGAPVAEDALFDSFWPDKDPSAARRNLAVTLSLARKALDVPGQTESVIHTDGRRHHLALRPTDHVDTEEFEAAAAAALADRGEPARALLEHAEALWTGDPLPEERYADWTYYAWRERLTDRYTHVLAALTRAYGNAGRTEDAIRVARKSVERDPLDEAAQRELIASYARAGRRNHALRQFLACRRALVDDLGIEPLQATLGPPRAGPRRLGDLTRLRTGASRGRSSSASCSRSRRGSSASSPSASRRVRTRGPCRRAARWSRTRRTPAAGSCRCTRGRRTSSPAPRRSAGRRAG